jgi:uncharacterized protein
MLIEFRASNYKSIKEEQVFSMVAKKVVKELPDNIMQFERINLMKSAIIYGANGAGKSNLISAINALHFHVGKSAEYKNDEKIVFYTPFEFDEITRKKPVKLEITFIAKNNIKYNYQISYTEKAFVKEVLTFYPGKNPALLYNRTLKGIEFGTHFREDTSLIEKSLYPNQLFLSKVAKEKIETLKPVFAALHRHLSIHNIHANTFDDLLLGLFASDIIEDKDNLKVNMEQLLKVADLGIQGFNVKLGNLKNFSFPPDIPKNLRENILERYKYRVNTIHNTYKNGRKVGNKELDIRQESIGTQKLLTVGTFLFKGLQDGDIIVIDELDKSLHPLLTKLLIQLAHKYSDKQKSQLIFASHDVSLLNKGLFRRDQIYIASKKVEGNSSFNSLGDFQGIRKDLPLEKYYMKGLFGGTPVVNEYDLNLCFEPSAKAKKTKTKQKDLDTL